MPYSWPRRWPVDTHGCTARWVIAIPVHVISGFLGAGKTTLIQAQLAARRANERVAVVVNDFGEAALDRTVLVERGGATVREIPGGCVCCTAPEGFVAALGLLLDEVAPDRIFVEPTGLARPADLIDTIRRGPHRDVLEVAPLIVLVDPGQVARSDGARADLLRAQAEAADVLVINRTDLARPADIEALDTWISGLWPGPLRVIRTTHGELDVDVLSWPAGAGPRTPDAHHHAHPSTEGFVARTWVWSPLQTFSHRRLRAHLAALAQEAGMARAKGLFRTDQGVVRLEVAGDRVHESPSDYRRDSRVDVIMAADSGEDWGPIEDGFHTALLREEEQEVVADRIEVEFRGGQRATLDRAALTALPDGVPDVAALVENRRGAAARLSALIDDLDVPDDGTAVVVAADGFTAPPVPVAVLRAGLILHTLDAEPLAPNQGGPFRLLIPGDAGPAGPCSNVKGVVRIVFRGPSSLG